MRLILFRCSARPARPPDYTLITSPIAIGSESMALDLPQTRGEFVHWVAHVRPRGRRCVCGGQPQPPLFQLLA